MEIDDHVYRTLLGSLIPQYRLPWVEPIFVPGHPCYQAYCDMYDAYDHLLARLGLIDEDEDVEDIVFHLLDYAEILAKEMFRYGRLYERMQEKEESPF